MAAEHLTAASYPLHLGDKTFYVCPLSDKDITELTNWVRGHYINSAKQANDENVLRIAIEQASTLFAFTGQGAKILATVEGMSKLVQVMARKNHTQLTESELMQLILDDTNRREVNRVFKLQNITPATVGKKGVKNLTPEQKRNRQKLLSTKR